MAWIKFEKDLLTDPRVLRIAKNLQARWGISEVTAGSNEFEISNAVALPAVTLVCGALVRIWSLADTHVGTDDVLPLGFEELDEVVGIPGFCDLMPVDWLEKVDGHSVKLPHFHGHNGTEAKRKAVTQKRVAAFRRRNASALPDQTRPDQKREEQRATRLPASWTPSEPLLAWASKERPDLDFTATVAKFRDYWAGRPGSGGTKLDWDATFRNWVREEKPGRQPQKIKVDL